MASHRGQYVLGNEEGPGELTADLVDEVLPCQGRKRGERRGHGVGVADQHIDVATVSQDGVDHPLDLIMIADVGLDALGRRPRGRDVEGDRAGGIGVAPKIDHYVVAAAAQFACCRRADAAASTGDQRHLT